jgi:hypothetical protein
MATPTQPTSRYSFQLLRYVPSVVAREFFNIGLLLRGADSKLLDARFASDFSRLRCHPLVEMPYLEALRDEFEEHRLAGEGFIPYLDQLGKNLSTTLEITEPRALWGRDALAEMERLFETYVATAKPEHDSDLWSLPAPGSRAALRRRMDEVFLRYYLLQGPRGLKPDESVAYAGPRRRFTFDYSYQPNGATNYIHGIARRNEANDAEKLCFVLQRLAGANQAAALTVVLDEGVPKDTVELLESSGAGVRPLAALDELAIEIRGDLGL